ncbi:hypothetical protein LAZ67_7001757 [Cordylochernes scorpioides]|uniref:Uncharacterized protein n=1 Tax=Cordylochernes scorpioides TaxID=51811 RepID=A0ABY6KNH7_9ARAC|nr:hypothetical protein LAZ67_7001757 [Cordylochernes scorpioides]
MLPRENVDSKKKIVFFHQPKTEMSLIINPENRPMAHNQNSPIAVQPNRQILSNDANIQVLKDILNLFKDISKTKSNMNTERGTDQMVIYKLPEKTKKTDFINYHKKEVEGLKQAVYENIQPFYKQLQAPSQRLDESRILSELGYTNPKPFKKVYHKLYTKNNHKKDLNKLYYTNENTKYKPNRRLEYGVSTYFFLQYMCSKYNRPPAICQQLKSSIHSEHTDVSPMMAIVILLLSLILIVCLVGLIFLMQNKKNEGKKAKELRFKIKNLESSDDDSSSECLKKTLIPVVLRTCKKTSTYVFSRDAAERDLASTGESVVVCSLYGWTLKHGGSDNWIKYEPVYCKISIFAYLGR